MYLSEPTSQQVKLQHTLQSLGRNMRNKPTAAEYRLWYFLRGKRLGYQFRRQYPLFRFIVDFYCSAGKLVVEVDGPIHESHKDYDACRDHWLTSHGYAVLRFTNHQVIRQMPAVLHTIQKTLSTLSPLQEEMSRASRGTEE